MTLLSKLKHFHWQICIWKCRLPKWRPSCPGLNVWKGKLVGLGSMVETTTATLIEHQYQMYYSFNFIKQLLKLTNTQVNSRSHQERLLLLWYFKNVVCRTVMLHMYHRNWSHVLFRWMLQRGKLLLDTKHICRYDGWIAAEMGYVYSKCCVMDAKTLWVQGCFEIKYLPLDRKAVSMKNTTPLAEWVL